MCSNLQLVCDSLSFLPIPRPWYVAAAVPEPKDVVIILDVSGSMGAYDSGSGKTRLSLAKEAVNAVLDTLYPTDEVKHFKCTVGQNISDRYISEIHEVEQ